MLPTASALIVFSLNLFASMKRFLSLIYLPLLCVWASAYGQTKVLINAPDTVCMSSKGEQRFASINATLYGGSGGNVWGINTNNVQWTITPSTYNILYTANPGDPLSSKSLTLSFLDPGRYTIVATMKDDNGNTYTQTDYIQAQRCDIQVCVGQLTSAVDFIEDFGQPTGRICYPGDAAKPANQRVVGYTCAGYPLGDNFYFISSSSKGRDEWVDVPDHTGNGNGGMLVANSAIQPIRFYRRLQKGLCTGAVYNFSAWLLNTNGQQVFESTCILGTDNGVLTGYRYAGVTFRIVDANTLKVIDSFRTYDLSMNLDQPTWQRYGGSFKTPPGVSDVYVEIVNNNPGGCGNDIAIDDISFQYCSPYIFGFIDGRQSQAPADSLCEGAPVDLTAYYAPKDYFKKAVFRWQRSDDGGATWQNVSHVNAKDSILHFGAGELKGNRLTPVVIMFRVNIFEQGNENSPSCAAPSTPIKITVLPAPKITVSQDQICLGDSTILRASGGYSRYIWKNTSPPIIKDTLLVKPIRDSVFGVYGIADYGNNRTCRDSGFALVKVYNPPVVKATADPMMLCLGEEVTLKVHDTLSKFNVLWQPTNKTTTTITDIPPSLGQRKYVVTVTNVKCVVKDSVTVDVMQVPVANAGPDQSLCNTPDFTLQGQLATGQAGEWTIISDPGGTAQLEDKNKPNSKLTSVKAGTSVTLRWYVTNSAFTKCWAADTVIITSLAPINNNVIEADQIICPASRPAPFTGKGSPAGGTSTYTYRWQISNDGITFTNIAGATQPDYNYNAIPSSTVLYFKRIVTSGACTSESNIIKVTVSNNPPTASPMADITTECEAGKDYTTLFDSPVFNHPDGMPLTFSTPVDNITGTCPTRITRTWTAKDPCNRVATATQTIIVRDTKPPVFNLPLPAADTTVNCDAIPVQPIITGTDNCTAGTITATIQETKGAVSPGCASSYTLTRVWTIRDACNNAATYTQLIHVQDTTKPVFNVTIPKDTTVNCDRVPTAPAVTGRDNCNGNQTITATMVETRRNLSATCASNYELTRVWTIKDPCGNTTTATQIITVQDTTRPTFTTVIPRDTVVNCDRVPTAPTVTGTDNCNGSQPITATMVESRRNLSATCASNYELTRTWTLTDPCGNTATGRQIITVQDTTRPTFTTVIPKDTTVNCDRVPAAPTVTGTDNCNGSQPITATMVETRRNLSATCASNYELTRTWTLTDPCGNITTAKQIITVQDTTKPVFNVAIPKDTTVNCDRVPTAPTVTGTDNCNGNQPITATLVETRRNLSATCASNYELTRTWTLTDPCGNITTARQIITVQDTTKPTFTTVIPKDTTVNCDMVPTAPTVTGTDNCNGSQPITATMAETRRNLSATCASNYELTRTWTLTDPCGNIMTAKQIITVQDTTKPTFTTLIPKDTTVNCDQVPAAPTVTGTDNCNGSQPITATLAETRRNLSATCASNYELTRIWTLTDPCGNIMTAKQIITVQDTTKPTFTTVIPKDTTVNCDQVPAAPTVTGTDNCNGNQPITATLVESRRNLSATCASNYELTRTWTLTDPCGNIMTAKQIITVQDTTRPVFNVVIPRDTTVNCDMVPAAPTVTGTDNCNGNQPITATVVETRRNLSATCASNYELTRTWTLTDPCGNITTARQIITVQDTTKPVFNVTIPRDTTVNCDQVPTAPTVTGTDNCNGSQPITATLVETRRNLSATCASNYKLTRTWTLTDPCGNITTATQIITVQDTTKPVFNVTIPRDTIVNCDMVPTAPTVTGTDNCNGNQPITATMVETRRNLSATCASNYELTRTWTLTDPCGNIMTAKQIITVQDTTKPVFNVIIPRDTTVNCDQVPAAPTVTGTDNCNGNQPITATLVETRRNLSATCASNYELTRTWTLTDPCGNITTAKQIITVQDTTRPVFNVIIPRDTTVNCDMVPAAPTVTGMDNCNGNQPITATLVETRRNLSATCASNYELTRTWTLTDPCGNITTARQIITVQDTTKPVFNVTIPRDTTVNCDQVPAVPTVTGTDNCNGSQPITATMVETRRNLSATCASNYELTRVWTLTDPCGNITTAIQIITVQDTTKPTFTTVIPKDTTVNCDQVPTAPTVTGTDNCNGNQPITATMVETRRNLSATCASNYELIRTWTLTDPCGNITTARQIIIVQDTTRPTFTTVIPKDTTVNCDMVPAAPTVTGTDNCNGSQPITATLVETRRNLSATCASNYELTRTWTLTDPCGNITTATQIITVQDTTKPVFNVTIPRDTIVNCDMVPTAPTVTGTDNCNGNQPITATMVETRRNLSATCASNYELTRTWTLTDPCGNIMTAKQIITVQDTTKPVFNVTIPRDTTVNCDQVPAAPTVTGTDNCNGNQPITATLVETRRNLSATCVSNYELTRTWTLTDPCGNTATAKQIITVQDTTKPVFNVTIPRDTTVNCDQVPAMPTLTGTDNCVTGEIKASGNEIKVNLPNSCVNNYRLIRTWILIDDCGNTTTATQTITVQDTTKPVFNVTIPKDTIVNCDQVPAAPTVTGTDNCNGNQPITATMVETRRNLSATCTSNYELTRVWTLKDPCGNTATATQVITVQDTTRPVFNVTIPRDTTVNCDQVPAAPTVTGTDNCNGNQPITATLVETRRNLSATCVSNYELTRTWTLTDPCGNTATAKQIITVQDTTKPVFNVTIPRDTTVNCDQVPAMPTLTGTDNCVTGEIKASGNEIKVNLPNSCVNNYRLIRTWILIDDCGNTTTATQTITVQDTTKPVFNVTIPKDTIVNCDQVPAAPTVTGTDNCNGNQPITATMVETRRNLSATCTSNYELTRVWTLKDPCGNTATATQVITVQDTTRPVFNVTIPRDTTVNCDMVPAAPTVTGTDNCNGNQPITATMAETRRNLSATCASNYELTRTWTLIDPCGNTTIAKQVITVQDTTKPVFNVTIPKDTTVNCDMVPSAPTVTGTDNCNGNQPITATMAETRRNLSATCASNYELTRTWTLVDPCGNTTIAKQVITVQDTTRPVFNVIIPKDTTVNCDMVPAAPTVTGTDNCNGNQPITATMVETKRNLSATCTSNYELIRVWTLTDPCGNITTAKQVITVQDTTKPVFNVIIPRDTTVNCDAVPAAPTVTGTDNCNGNQPITATMAETRRNLSATCASNYELTRVWTLTDPCGNIMTAKQIITVQDTTKPVFNVQIPKDTTVNCDQIPAAPAVTGTDNCSASNGLTATLTETKQPIPNACANNYILVRKWVLKDDCGNAIEASQQIRVQDTTKPRFNVAIPRDTTVDCDKVPAQPALTGTDNCTPALITATNKETRVDIAGTCASNYRLIRTWTLTDECGNFTTATQTITVQDTTKPVFNVRIPKDTTVDCDKVPVQPTLTGVDNCTPGTIVASGKERRENIFGECDNHYRLIRTWTIVDRCGNDSTVTQVITVQDTTKPVFNVRIPKDTTVNCDQIPTMPTITGTDNCTPGVIVARAEERRETIPGACDNNYRLLRTWTLTDQCGLSVKATQVIYVQDTTKPVFNVPVPKDTTVNCDAVPARPVLTATDNCTPGVISVTATDTREEIRGSKCAANYRIIRTWTAMDQCGNSNTVKQVITVQDTTRPAFSIPQLPNVTVDCDKVPEWPVMTATDNCSGTVAVQTSQTKEFLSGTCARNYRLIRTWKATDACGNLATLQQIITVQDTTKPVFTVQPPADTTVSCDAIPAPPANISAVDNCSPGSQIKVVRTQERREIPGACSNNYLIIRTWTATDDCNNQAVVRQVITVKDTTRPVIAPAPADLTIKCGEAIPNAPVLTATDNCDASFPKKVTMTEDPYVKDVCSGYTIIRRWNIKDACDNIANEQVQRITVLPCPKPQIDPALPVNCSDNSTFVLQLAGKVNRPTFTLVRVTPANAVQVPLSQQTNIFNLNGATEAAFVVKDGVTGCVSDTVIFKLKYNAKPVVNLGRDTTLCGGNSLILDAGASNFAYSIRWSTGATTQRIPVTQAGTYWVTVTNGICSTTDTIKVAMVPTPLVALPDTTICRGQSVKLDAFVPGASYLWSNGATSSSILVSTQEQYWVKVMKSGCITIDTVKVTVNPPPDISLSRDTTICPDQSIILTVNTSGGRIRWQTGETTNSIVVSKPGNYWVSVSSENCVVRDTVHVRLKPSIKVDLGPDRQLCPGAKLTLNGTNPDAVSYLWNDGDTNPVKEITQAGKYKLAVMDRFCQRIVTDSMKVTMEGAPVINLGRDTVMCKGEKLILRADAPGVTGIRWSDGSTGPTLTVTEAGTYAVTVFNECGSSTDQITVDFIKCEPKPTLPNAFSPNGDGRNDIFRPVVRGPMYNYELRVFNRWGELIFITSDDHRGWDGKYRGAPVDNGTYVWWLTYKKVPGGEPHVLKGEVTVIR